MSKYVSDDHFIDEGTLLVELESVEEVVLLFDESSTDAIEECASWRVRARRRGLPLSCQPKVAAEVEAEELPPRFQELAAQFELKLRTI